MFGFYRTFLALAVMAQHLIGVPFIGVFAVHGFFILSGFLMTTIMHETYGYNLRGFGAFWGNRIARLYPVYLVVLAGTIGLIFGFGEPALKAYRAVIYLPPDLSAWLANLSMCYPNFFPGIEEPRLSPATWALTIELFFYLLISLGLSRNKQWTLLFFVSACLYTAATFQLELGAMWRFGSIASGALPFSLGALLFHYQEPILMKLKRFRSTGTILLVFGLYVLNPALVEIGERLTGVVYLTPAYLANYVIHFLLIALLFQPKSFPLSKKWDNAIGDLSYPIYLVHWQAGFLASMVLFQAPVWGPSWAGLMSFCLAVLLVLGLAQGLVLCIDRPINQIRSRLKKWVRDTG